MDGQNLRGGVIMKKNNNYSLGSNLDGRIALIVGGGGSIGSEISKAYLSAGATIIIAGVKNSLSNISLQTLIENSSSTYFQVDVANEASVESLYNKVLLLYGRIDIIVLANGIQLRKPFYEYTINEWRMILDVNLTGCFLICKYFSKSMIDNNYGRIIGITSLTTEIGIKNISAYSASKGGMNQFLKSIAIELAKYNIIVNMIAPGRINTNMTNDLTSKTNLNESIIDRIPMGRYGNPSDLIGAALFLASKEAAYMTGQSIIIDGGWLASGGNLPG